MLSFNKKRFGLNLKEEEIIPCFGTREVLFNFPQFLLFDIKEPLMAFTNPFYQIYEGAAIASRAKMLLLNLTPENDFKPEMSKEELDKSAERMERNFITSLIIQRLRFLV